MSETGPGIGQQAFRASVDLDTFAKAVESVEILAVALVGCHCQLTNRALVQEQSSELQMVTTLLPAYKVVEAENGLAALITLQVTYAFSFQDQPAMLLHAAFQADYRVGSDFTDAVFQVFCRGVLLVHLVPFMREFFWNVTSRMNIPEFLLPVFRPEAFEIIWAGQDDKK